jgi:hypothetical protein
LPGPGRLRGLRKSCIQEIKVLQAKKAKPDCNPFLITVHGLENGIISALSYATITRYSCVITHHHPKASRTGIRGHGWGVCRNGLIEGVRCAASCWGAEPRLIEGIAILSIVKYHTINTDSPILTLEASKVRHWPELISEYVLDGKHSALTLLACGSGFRTCTPHQVTDAN